MGNGYVPSIVGRKRAIALKAVDANQLLNASLPLVLPILTHDQMEQIQEVLDAAVVNPEIVKEYQALMQKSIVAQSGSVINRDPKIVHRANKLIQKRIVATESDRRIRIDFIRLLAADALTPRTDNPDEVAYLEKVRQTLVKEGIWLRVTQPFMRDPNSPSSSSIDPRTFQVWLSLGFDGDHIPIGNSPITREQLLETTVLGAGYYTEVHQGKIQSMLDAAIRRVRSEISSGETFHEQQEDARREARYHVEKVSDALGRATYPDKSIWDTPNELVRQALTQNIKGNIKDSSETISFAAISAQVAAEILDEYNQATMKGAGRAVKIITVVQTLAKIAEYILIVRGLVGGLIRLMATRGTAAEAAGATAVGAGKNHSPAAYYPTNHNSLPARYPTRPNPSPAAQYPTNYQGKSAWEKTMNQVGNTKHTDAGMGTAINRVDLATQQTINGWHDDFAKKVKDLMTSKGDTKGGWVVSKDELVALDKEVSAKWGDIWALFD